MYVFWSEYTSWQERKCGKFLQRANSHWLWRPYMRWRLRRLMQRDLVTLNLVLEWQYKGYVHLTKKVRKEAYRNTHLLLEAFNEYWEADGLSTWQQRALQIGFDLDATTKYEVLYLTAIMLYLSPRSERVKYRESTSFDQLLHDPQKQVLVGDCNQLVTLAVALYARRYPITDLQVKLKEHHVLLYYRGYDIEMTAGRIVPEPDHLWVGPITELMALNILDVADPDQATTSVPYSRQLKAAELAYSLSGHRDLTTKNLQTARRNRAIEALNADDLKTAATLAKLTGDKQLMEHVAAKRVQQLVGRGKFAAAERLVKKHNLSAYREYVQQSELREFLKDQKHLSQKQLKRVLYLSRELHEGEVQSWAQTRLKQKA